MSWRQDKTSKPERKKLDLISDQAFYLAEILFIKDLNEFLKEIAQTSPIFDHKSSSPISSQFPHQSS